MYDIQPGAIFEDGYKRPVHIVSRSPWDKDLLLGVFMNSKCQIKTLVYMRNGKAFGKTDEKAHLIKLIGESPCLTR